MKKLASIILTSLIILTGMSTVFAIPYDYRGGVANSDVGRYSEYVFLSGRPVKFVGTYVVSHPIRKKGNTWVSTYSFTLEGDKSGDSLTREVTFTTTVEDQEDFKQAIGNTELTSFRESVTVDGNSYELDKYLFTKAGVNDKVPASDFYKATIKSKRIYKVNGNEGTVTIDTTGQNTGYYNIWGNAEAMRLENSIVAKRATRADLVGVAELGKRDGSAFKPFTGSYTVNVVDSNTISLQYEKNEANISSIAGNVNKIEKYEAVSNYTFVLPPQHVELPVQNEKGEVVNKNVYHEGKGEVSLRETTMPRLEPTIAPKLRDVNGTPSEDAIKKLYSLNVMEDTGGNKFKTSENTLGDKFKAGNKTVTRDTEDTFSGHLKMSRIEFIRPFLNICNLRHEIEEVANAPYITIDSLKEYNHKNDSTNEQKGIYALNYENYFLDIKDNHPDYELIENGVATGVIKGRRRTRFRPDDNITKSEIATFMTRALGMENRAPNPNFMTKYEDDKKIGNWARDSVYVLTEIGIFEPDENGRVNPHATITRAEGAEILVRFLEFLEKDLKKDYFNLIKY